MSAPLPWLEEAWRQWTWRLDAASVPHAVLLAGPPGVGKRRFARALAQALLCESSATGARPCGQCRGCRHARAGHHPDLLEVCVGADSQQIRVSQIHDLRHFMGLSRERTTYKVALMLEAERMNPSAANAMLKTLEEPPAGSVVLLHSGHAGLLPATVRSRCQVIRLPKPPRAQAASWLQAQVSQADAEALLGLALGAPLSALAYADDDWVATRREVLDDLRELTGGRQSPLRTAQRWLQYPPETLLGWLLSWLTDIARLHGVGCEAEIDNADVRTLLHELAQTTQPARLFDLYDELLAHRRLAASAVNRELAMDDVALACQRLGVAPPSVRTDKHG